MSSPQAIYIDIPIVRTPVVNCSAFLYCSHFVTAGLILRLKEVPLLVNYIAEIMKFLWLHLVRLNSGELTANRDVLRLSRLGEATELDALAEQQAVG